MLVTIFITITAASVAVLKRSYHNSIYNHVKIQYKNHRYQSNRIIHRSIPLVLSDPDFDKPFLPI